jgi:hypothetical protein
LEEADRYDIPRSKRMSETIPTKVAIGESVLFQDLEDEIVLLNMENQQYFGLNDVGANMWKCLMEAKDVASAGDRLCELYETEKTVVLADLEQLVRDLLARGLLKAA